MQRYAIRIFLGFTFMCLLVLPMQMVSAQIDPHFGQEIHRCMTPAYIDYLKASERGEAHPMAVVFKDPSRDGLNSYQSPSGHFTFWYEIEGPNAIPLGDTTGTGIPDWIEMAGLAADQAWEVFIDELGFLSPIQPDETYEIYIEALGFYGFTGLANDNPYSVIDSTFDWVPGNDHENDAVGAAQVTIAHEFYHAIQYTYNQWSGPTGETAWLEMDAVMAENLAFPDVNEYLNLIGSGSIFSMPSRSTPVEYDHTTWMMYFAERYEPGFFRQIWEHISDEPEITMRGAIAHEVSLRGDDIRDELTRLYLWHLASGNWSRDGFGFAQADRYPTSFKRTSRVTVPVEPYPMWSINKLAANFHAISPAAQDTGDVLIALFSDNLNTGIGLLAYFEDGSTQEQIFGSVQESPMLINTGWRWEDVDRIGVAISNTGETQSHIHQWLAGAGPGIEQIKYGDINRNGQINLTDAVKLLGHRLNPVDNPLTFAQVFAADVSGEFGLSAFDAGLVYRYSSGFMDQFPADISGTGFGPEYSHFYPSEKPVPAAGAAELIIAADEVYKEEEISIPLQLLGFSDPVLSVELDLLFSDELLEFQLVSQEGSIFDELVQDVRVSGDTLRVAWASNRFETGSAVGNLNFTVLEEGTAFLVPLRMLVNESQTPVDLSGVTFEVEDNPAVSVGDDDHHPEKTALLANYPNPFNHQTVIPFRLAEPSAVTIEVFDVTGRKAATLTNRSQLQSGSHEVRFDAGGLASGVYLVRFRAESAGGIQTFTGRITLLK